jgi:urease accessory protein
MPTDADAGEIVAPTSAAWRARLDLRFAHDGQRTWLAQRRHEGPLVVQKPLYPEGPTVCQAIVVHPPGGIANGDRLDVAVGLDEGAHAQFTTPGATKWYRGCRAARQTLSIVAAPGSVIEWLPQGTIIYNGANACVDTRIALEHDAVFVGWDIVCLGRIAAGERFVMGMFQQRTELVRDGALVWSERARLPASAPLLHVGAGLNGRPVFGTFLASAAQIDDQALFAARSIVARSGDCAVTRLPGVLIGRFLGASSEAAFDYFVALWSELRPLLIARPAVHARIWKT